MGADVVRKEIEKCKLKQFENVRLVAIMERAAEDNLLPKDAKSLGDGLKELRIEGDNRIFRLFYADADDDGPVLLALKFINKKSSQGIATSPRDVETARKRHAEWRNRVMRDQSEK
ncbi:type II toxin-antitoxin system RelE/ParE family toxin [Kitasatospora phosalacinea]|nr:type II toxin-antitoxin system RelE/ParE family toxin [Kitasatospora phosalacinea]